MDTTAIALPYGKSERPVPTQKYRDLLKIAAAMTDGKVAYFILGMENQSEMHYAMPPKNMLYDAAEYTAQVEETAKLHRKEKEKPETSAEYLSGFYRTDELLPVITLTIYFGAEKWTAPKSLHEMFSKTISPEILQFVPDYRINLIAPAEIPDENFSKFQTELRIVLEYIKNSNDKEKLRKLVQENHAYRNVSKKTVDLVNTMTNSNLQYPEREENVDMCKAIEGMLEDSRQEGKIEAFLSLVKEGILTIEDAAKRANMTVEEFTAKTSAM